MEFSAVKKLYPEFMQGIDSKKDIPEKVLELYRECDDIGDVASFRIPREKDLWRKVGLLIIMKNCDRLGHHKVIFDVDVDALADNKAVDRFDIPEFRPITDLVDDEVIVIVSEYCSGSEVFDNRLARLVECVLRDNNRCYVIYDNCYLPRTQSVLNKYGCNYFQLGTPKKPPTQPVEKKVSEEVSTNTVDECAELLRGL